MFGPRRKEAMGGRSKLRSEERRNVQASTYVIPVKVIRMGEADLRSRSGRKPNASSRRRR